MSGEVEKCPILHVRPKFDVFTLLPYALADDLGRLAQRLLDLVQDSKMEELL